MGVFGYSILQSVICTHVRSSGFELQRSLHCLDLIRGEGNDDGTDDVGKS